MQQITLQTLVNWLQGNPNYPYRRKASLLFAIKNVTGTPLIAYVTTAKRISYVFDRDDLRLLRVLDAKLNHERSKIKGGLGQYEDFPGVAAGSGDGSGYGIPGLDDASVSGDGFPDMSGGGGIPGIPAGSDFDLTGTGAGIPGMTAGSGGGNDLLTALAKIGGGLATTALKEGFKFATSQIPAPTTPAPTVPPQDASKIPIGTRTQNGQWTWNGSQWVSTQQWVGQAPTNTITTPPAYTPAAPPAAPATDSSTWLIGGLAAFLLALSLMTAKKRSDAIAA